jgi:hypothetical protein
MKRSFSKANPKRYSEKPQSICESNFKSMANHNLDPDFRYKISILVLDDLWSHSILIHPRHR